MDALTSIAAMMAAGYFLLKRPPKKSEQQKIIDQFYRSASEEDMIMVPKCLVDNGAIFLLPRKTWQIPLTGDDLIFTALKLGLDITPGVILYDKYDDSGQRVYMPTLGAHTIPRVKYKYDAGAAVQYSWDKDELVSKYGSYSADDKRLLCYPDSEIKKWRQAEIDYSVVREIILDHKDGKPVRHKARTHYENVYSVYLDGRIPAAYHANTFIWKPRQFLNDLHRRFWVHYVVNAFCVMPWNDGRFGWAHSTEIHRRERYQFSDPKLVEEEKEKNNLAVFPHGGHGKWDHPRFDRYPMATVRTAEELQILSVQMIAAMSTDILDGVDGTAYQYGRDYITPSKPNWLKRALADAAVVAIGAAAGGWKGALTAAAGVAVNELKPEQSAPPAIPKKEWSPLWDFVPVPVRAVGCLSTKKWVTIETARVRRDNSIANMWDVYEDLSLGTHNTLSQKTKSKLSHGSLVMSKPSLIQPPPQTPKATSPRIAAAKRKNENVRASRI